MNISNQYVADMFDSVPAQEFTLDGIMGNGELDKFERGEIIKLLRKTIKEDDIDVSKKVLDAGCGLGRNVPVLQAVNFIKIECIDFSKELLKMAKERFPAIPFRYLDLSDLSEIEDNYFETAFVMYVFIHIVDEGVLQKTIAELERVTHGPIIIGQVMDAEQKSESKICKVREIFELLPYFKRKGLHHFYKNMYSISSRCGTTNSNISFAVFKDS